MTPYGHSRGVKIVGHSSVKRIFFFLRIWYVDVSFVAAEMGSANFWTWVRFNFVQKYLQKETY